MSESTVKRTALYQEHLKLNGKMVSFAGWEMPIQYRGLAHEHEACRTKIGLFDVSHMGEVRVRGKDSLEFLNNLVTNDVAKIKDGQAQYTVMCYPHGGCVDDLIIHRISGDEFFICVNASNTDKDFAWIRDHAPSNVSVTNESPLYSQIAIQGQKAQELLQKFTRTNLSEIKYYWFKSGEVLNEKAYIARTGYTGEDGFEIYVPWDFGPRIWSALLEEGARFGIEACGLGARDTLRTEMKFPLYGHEIDENQNPLFAGLGWVTKLDKPNFIGRDSLLKIKEGGVKKSSVGLISTTKAIPRQGYTIEKNGKSIGIVTSGTMSPSLKVGIAIASVDKEFSAEGTVLDVVVRETRVPHTIVKTPFYKRPY